jgi:polar amino acid transport system substrate-binding protein
MRTLTAGIFEHTPRMSFIDVHGERTGLCVEVAEMIGVESGSKIDLKTFDRVDKAMGALREGNIDFFAMELTPQFPPPAGIIYTEPFFFTDVVAYARSTVVAKHWRDLNTPSIKLMVGESSSYIHMAPEFLPLAPLMIFGSSGLQTAAAIAGGKADAGLKDVQLALQYPRVHPELRILDGVLTQVPECFAVRADGAALLNELNASFAQFRERKTYQQRLDYWVRGWSWEKDHKDPRIPSLS